MQPYKSNFNLESRTKRKKAKTWEPLFASKEIMRDRTANSPSRVFAETRHALYKFLFWQAHLEMRTQWLRDQDLKCNVLGPR